MNSENFTGVAHGRAVYRSVTPRTFHGARLIPRDEACSRQAARHAHPTNASYSCAIARSRPTRIILHYPIRPNRYLLPDGSPMKRCKLDSIPVDLFQTPAAGCGRNSNNGSTLLDKYSGAVRVDAYSPAPVLTSRGNVRVAFPAAQLHCG